jgi:transcriptional regulator with XRE-family HTH domain
MARRAAEVDVQARFGANLRACRRAAEMSQEHLAFASGMHRTEISLLERGARDPRLSTIARLALALGKDSAELVAGIVPPDE